MTTTHSPASQTNRIDEPLYNSILIRNYILYVSEYYPGIDIDPLLEQAGITKYEIEDQGHWLSQRQVDSFYDLLRKKTGNPNLAREVGRYAASPRLSSALRQYALGFITPNDAYRMLKRQASTLSRGFTLKTRKLSGNKLEVTATLAPGVDEKPNQCENRIGIFEAVAKLFTEDYADVEHPSCYHRGDDSCVYIISWSKLPSITWKVIRNYTIAISSLLAIILFFYMPTTYWFIFILIGGLVSLAISVYSQNLKINEMIQTIRTQGNAANDLLNEMNTRHENAMLIQEIGQATSSILDINRLFKTVTSLMEKRLDFDRGMIMVPNEDKTFLLYKSGYGYNKEIKELLSKTSFSLENPLSKGMAVQAFKLQETFQINDVSKVEGELSEKSIEFIQQIKAKSFICVPIVYEKESLGILAVDNVKSKRPFTQSDISLLLGVASLTAVSIINAMSFKNLQESEKKYRELVETANSIIMRMDISGKITFFNNFAQRFFGYSEDEILGMSVNDTILTEARVNENATGALIDALKADPELQIVQEAENILRNGDYVWVAWTYKPIFDNDGSMKEILCIGNDITANKLSSQEKEVLEAQLQASQKMEAVGTLAGGIAHDFNNILQAILSNIQVLMMSKDLYDSQKQKILSAVERSVERANDLTKRLLIFSRKVESHLRPINIRYEVEQIIKMLERTIPKMISIELNINQDIKTVNADPSQIEQILLNLAINARDAMSDGGSLTFGLENVSLDKKYCKNHLGLLPGEYVLMSVSDTGHGIDQETQKHIFEPFFTTKETGKGTGLGLATVYGIIKNHGGYVLCESRPGHGSVFKIFFPVIEEDYELPKEKKEKPQIEGGNETILLVDDEEGLRTPTEILLKSHGYSVISAPNGETALEIYQKSHQEIDLILLDLIMPGMGGERCLEELIRINKMVKVIVISGYADSDLEDSSVDRYAKDFVVKPYESARLLNIIRKVIDEK